MLAAERRIGKSDLIFHLFNQSEIKDNYHTFYVDIYTTKSLNDFVLRLGKAIYQELKPKRTVWAERFFQAISSLRVGFKLDAVTGEPKFDLGVGEIRSPQTTLDEIFEYLENADKPCVVAIDEFQQIGEYSEGTVEALLRTKIQQCRQTQFIYSGSRRHVMNTMFNSPSRPFYHSTINMGLEVIPRDVYMDFTERMFGLYGFIVNDDLVEKVYANFGGCTWYLQMMMNELFTLTGENGVCDIEKYDTALRNIIQVQRWTYEDILAQLPAVKKQVLLAIAKAGNATRITSADFIERYALKSASSVQSAMKSLLERDLVTFSNNTYRVTDYFFAEWIRDNC